MKKRLLFALIAIVAVGGVIAKMGVTPAPPKVTPAPSTAYTVMIYMNGSDLESEFGAATDDLAEMLDSGLAARNANVLILTGGTNRWQNAGIPETECIIWRLADGELFELETMGKVNMGNPDTLRDFIQFSRKNFPAEKYGLIMWDHGGGSIVGFGHDEKFYDDALMLADLKKAFDEAGLGDDKLEFLGFDACLMATVEMAVLARDYARVLVASEDLEPGEGWDYRFLAALNDETCGFTLGEIIVDTFFAYYESRGLAEEEILTLSVVDLENVGAVMDALGRLVPRELPEPAFRKMAARRARTKTFGECSPRDNYADMVDIGDMARQLADIYPCEAEAVLAALENCVTYNRHNSDTEIYGLSTFYIYGGKSQGAGSLRTYSALEADPDYTRYLHRFFEGLLETRESESIHTEIVLWEPLGGENYRIVALFQDEITLVPKIGDEFVTLFPVSETAFARRFAIPAEVNGREAEIIVSNEKILGARFISPGAFQKGHAPLEAGDIIAFFRLEYDFAANTDRLTLSDPLTLTAPPQLTFHPPPPHLKQGLRHTDLCHNIFYSAPRKHVI